MEPRTYEQVHAGLFYTFGKASRYQCFGCDRQAMHWAYMYNAGDQEITCPRGRKYADNFDFYEPLCPACHKRQDIHREPRLVEMMKRNAVNWRSKRTQEHITLAGKKSMAIRRKCVECGMVTSPAALGKHFKASGHREYLEVAA